MTVYLYINKTGNPLHVKSISFAAGGQKKFVSTQEDLDKLAGLQLDRYVDDVLDNTPWNDSSADTTATAVNKSNQTLALANGDQIELSRPFTNRQKLDRLSPKSIGFNYYSLVYEQLIGGNAAAIAARPSLLAAIAASGANMVRIALPCFSAAEYLSYVHNTGTMPSRATSTNFRPTYVAAVDLAMDQLAAYGLKAHVCEFWGQNILATACGETNAIAYGSTSSATYVYAASVVEWFFKRYRNHPAFGVYSFGNEWVTDSAGVTNPTPTQLGNWFASLASVGREIRGDKIITTDIMLPGMSVAATRETIDQFGDRMALIFAGLDALCLHVYGINYSFVGINQQDNGAFPNSSSNQLGFESIQPLMRACRAMADSMNKPLIIGEFGVSTAEELETTQAKARRVTKAVAANAEYGMFWNVQDVSIGTGNQSTWFMSAGTARMAKFQSIALDHNKSRVGVPQIPVALKAGRLSTGPEYAFKSARTAATTVRVTSTAAQGSTTGYGMMFWMRHDALMNAFEGLADLRNSTTSGIALLATPSASNSSLYAEGRYASGNAGNTNGILPDFALNEFNHFALLQQNTNGTPAFQVWVNGLYWKTVTSNALAATIPAATVLYVGGGSTSGAPVSMQDFALVSGASPQDVMDHMGGAVVRGSLLHLRALPNGNIVDLGVSALAVTIGAGVTVVSAH